MLLLFCGEALAQGCGAYATKISTLKERGGRVDWSRAHGLIAYDFAAKAKGYFDIHVMSVDRALDYCVTCTPQARAAGLKKHNGNPAWHPSGEYLVFQGEIADSKVSAKWSNPGRGVNNVLWLAHRMGTEFHRLTEFSEKEARGVLHPHFSEDGTMLSWSEMYEAAALRKTGKTFGYWRLKTARFVTGDGAPRLAEVRTHLPMVEGFYENHGFSPDGSRLLFSSNAGRTGFGDRLNNDIFTLDLRSGAVVRLTDTRYNEHAHFFPGGRKVLWMSNREIPSRGTDLWIMNPDGSDKQRLTFFNQEGCAESAGRRAVPADSSINATGDKLVLYVQDEILGDVGSIRLVELSAGAP